MDEEKQYKMSLEEQVKNLEEERKNLISQILDNLHKINELQVMCFRIAGERDDAKKTVDDLERCKTLIQGKVSAYQFILDYLDGKVE